MTNKGDHNGMVGVGRGDDQAEKWAADQNDGHGSGETFTFLQGIGYEVEELGGADNKHFNDIECPDGQKPSTKRDDLKGWTVGGCIDCCSDGDEYSPDERVWNADKEKCECETGEFVTDSLQFPGEGKCLTASSGQLVWYRLGGDLNTGVTAWQAARDVNNDIQEDGIFGWPVPDMHAYHCDGTHYQAMGGVIEVKVTDKNPDGTGETFDKWAIAGQADSYQGVFDLKTLTGYNHDGLTSPWPSNMEKVESLDTARGTIGIDPPKSIESGSVPYVTSFEPGTPAYESFVCDVCAAAPNNEFGIDPSSCTD